MAISEPPFRNRAKERLKSGDVVCGFGITSASVAVSQILAASGADLLTLDFEHGVIDLADAHAIIASTGGTRCVPIARVQLGDKRTQRAVLDAGALGIVFPMVRSRDDVEAGIDAVLYPPQGSRGIGHHFAPTRWGLGDRAYLEGANEALLKIVLIETREAVENIRDLLSVPGLDVATIAPGDLAASLGYPGDPGHAVVREAIQTVEEAILASDVALGGLATASTDAALKIDCGYQLLLLGFDVGLLRNTAAEMVGAAHSKPAR